MMRTTLIRIGNSRGVRLPKTVIEQAKLDAELELEVIDGAVVIRPAAVPRPGWSEAAAACHEVEEDRLDDWDAVTGEQWGTSR